MTEIAMPDTAPSEPKRTGKKKKLHPTPWRDNVEAMLMAIVMALVLKYFIVEAYRIPTGSMQPTLMGNAKAGIFDRILVDKWSYQVRDPRRWEVAVFRYPLDRSKNYVKRIVGVGPEQFRVHGGDLWRRDDASQPWEILRRPRNVQDETWLAMEKAEPDGPLFFGVNQAGWEAGRDVTLDGDFRMRFGRPGSYVRDGYRDGYPDSLKDAMPRSQGPSGSKYVSDLRVDGSVEVSADTQELVIELQEGPRRYFFRLPGPAAPADAVARIEARMSANTGPGVAPFVADVESEGLRFLAGRSYDFTAQNLDDLCELFVDGEAVCQLEVPAADNAAALLFLETTGGRTELADLMVYRDIHYTDDKGSSVEVTIPDGHYFMMGDNTLDSADSRVWRMRHLEVTSVDGTITELAGNHRAGNGQNSQSDFANDVNPLTSSMGHPELELTTWFRDEWGELHTMPAASVKDASPMTTPAPFVPRHMMLGRAISVFWPIKPLDGVWRFKKVD